MTGTSGAPAAQKSWLMLITCMEAVRVAVSTGLPPVVGVGTWEKVGRPVPVSDVVARLAYASIYAASPLVRQPQGERADASKPA
jgi:hypothetical protein